ANRYPDRTILDSPPDLVLLQARSVYWVHLFFFQAEDGIRDFHVTGVQTCALPISAPAMSALHELLSGARHGMRGPTAAPELPRRSEERRVGKECRDRPVPYHQNDLGSIEAESAERRQRN